jgi:hypothetical protein
MGLQSEMVMLLGCYNHYREKKAKVNRLDHFGPNSEHQGKRGLSPRLSISVPEGFVLLMTKDNAVGVLIGRALSNRKRALDTEHLLIVDAAEIGETLGTVRWILKNPSMG